MSRPTDPIRYFLNNYKHFVMNRGERTDSEVAALIEQHKKLVAEGLSSKDARKLLQREQGDIKSFEKRGLPQGVYQEASKRYFQHMMVNGTRMSTTYSTYDEMMENYQQWRKDVAQ